MCSENVRSTASGFQPLMEIDIAMAGFQQEWASCDLVASYLAGLVNDGTGDTLLRTSLMSAALNELFETVFRSASGNGHVNCRIALGHDHHRVELSFEALPGLKEQFEAALSSDKERVLADYLAGLQSAMPPGPAAALSGLAVNFMARVSPLPAGESVVAIAVDLPFDGAEH